MRHNWLFSLPPITFWTHFYNMFVYKACLKSYVNGVISERKLGACVRPCSWFFRDVGIIDTQRGLHVTGSVNRLRPVNVVSVRGSVTAQRAKVKFCWKLGKTTTERVTYWYRCTGGKPLAENVLTNGSHAFTKGHERLRMSHVRVFHQQAEPRNDQQSATNAATRSATVGKIDCGGIGN